jgi:hypothetical protein
MRIWEQHSTAFSIRPHSSEICNRLADGCQHLFIVGETQPIFLGDYTVAEPDGELPPIAFNQIRLDIQFSFEQLRHTGGPRQVVSNDAVAYGNWLHCGNLL